MLEKYQDILTVKDVHDILGIGYNKTYELLKDGSISCFRIGKEIKIPKISLERYILKMAFGDT